MSRPRQNLCCRSHWSRRRAKAYSAGRPHWTIVPGMKTTRDGLFDIVLFFALGHLLIGATPVAAQGDCRLVFEATSKVFDTPVHSYVTTSTGGTTQPGGEMIYLGGASYLKSGGKWSPGIVSIQEMKQLLQTNIHTNKTTCRYLKDEPVNGEMAGVYSVHEEAPRSTSDSQIWISKAKGLPLRSELDLGPKMHISTRYEYGNVKAPM
jgi:hypothetical protein